MVFHFLFPHALGIPFEKGAFKCLSSEQIWILVNQKYLCQVYLKFTKLFLTKSSKCDKVYRQTNMDIQQPNNKLLKRTSSWFQLVNNNTINHLKVINLSFHLFILGECFLQTIFSVEIWILPLVYVAIIQNQIILILCISKYRAYNKMILCSASQSYIKPILWQLILLSQNWYYFIDLPMRFN